MPKPVYAVCGGYGVLIVLQGNNLCNRRALNDWSAVVWQNFNGEALIGGQNGVAVVGGPNGDFMHAYMGVGRSSFDGSSAIELLIDTHPLWCGRKFDSKIISVCIGHIEFIQVVAVGADLLDWR